MVPTPCVLSSACLSEGINIHNDFSWESDGVRDPERGGSFGNRIREASPPQIHIIWLYGLLPYLRRLAAMETRIDWVMLCAGPGVIMVYWFFWTILTPFKMHISYGFPHISPAIWTHLSISSTPLWRAVLLWPQLSSPALKMWKSLGLQYKCPVSVYVCLSNDLSFQLMLITWVCVNCNDYMARFRMTFALLCGKMNYKGR